MKPDDYLAVLEQAADSEYGIRVALAGWTPAERVRRRLYLARDKARARGDLRFDHLSILLHPTGELRIVHRDRMPEPIISDDELGVCEARPISIDDLPPRILARGPNRRHPPRPIHDPMDEIVARVMRGDFDPPDPVELTPVDFDLSTDDNS